MARKLRADRRLRSALLAALTIALSCALAPPPAHAWNSGGHRISALIAWQSLEPTTREQVAALLRLHPDHARWIAHARGADPDQTAFVEASTWPDELRSDPRFHDPEDEAKPLLPAPLPGFPDMERHRQWHYLNRPINAAPSSVKDDGELDRQIGRLAEVLDSDAAASRRAWALPWLIHLVGDAHQPLHVGTRVGADGKSDAGGNGFIIDNPFQPNKRLGNLHRYWDDRVAPLWLRGEALNAAAAALMNANPPPAPAGGVALWIDESFAIAANEAYPPTSAASSAPTLIDADFDERAGQIADRRVAWSGYRLADLLRQIFARR